jgi:hypothetical protein
MEIHSVGGGEFLRLLSACLSSPPPISVCISEPIFEKFGMHIMAPEPNSTAYFLNNSDQSVFLYIVRVSHNVVRQ